LEKRKITFFVNSKFLKQLISQNYCEFFPKNVGNFWQDFRLPKGNANALGNFDRCLKVSVATSVTYFLYID